MFNYKDEKFSLFLLREILACTVGIIIIYIGYDKSNQGFILTIMAGIVLIYLLIGIMVSGFSLSRVLTILYSNKEDKSIDEDMMDTFKALFSDKNNKGNIKQVKYIISPRQKLVLVLMILPFINGIIELYKIFL